MAKKEKKEKQEKATRDPHMESLSLTKVLISEMNKNGEEKIAWCLGTDNDDPTTVREFINTGSTLLNYIIANRRDGGVPQGKIVEVIGDEASGKSLLCMHLAAECQKKGGLVVYADEENALNPDFCQRVGVDINKLVYLQCGSVEAVGEQIEKIIILARAKNVKCPILVIWDGIAGTPTRIELEGNYDLNMNVQMEKSKVLSKMMRKLTKMVGAERVTMVFTNQIRTKIGVMFGDPTTTPGGKAVPFHASVRLRMYRSGELDANKPEKPEPGQPKPKHTKSVFGVHTRVKVIKNRMGAPFRTCEFDIHFADGINDVESIRDYLLESKLAERAMGYVKMTNVERAIEKETKEGELVIRDPETGELYGPELVEELKVRPDAWVELFNRDPIFKEYVMKILDRRLILTYKEKEVPDMDLDPESLMDAEAVEQMVVEGMTEPRAIGPTT